MTLQKYFKLYNFSFLIIIILHLAYIIYGDSFTYPLFIFDDNEHYTKSLSFFNKSLFGLIIDEKTAMPVFYKTWSLLNYFQPIYHVLILRITNLLLHAANSVLFYYIFTFLFKLKPKAIFFLASIIFFVHPLQVESVVWLSSMKGTLALFLSLTSWSFFIIHERKYASLFYLLSLLTFILALLCKVTIATLPVAMLLTHRYLITDEIKSHYKNLNLKLIPYFLFSFCAILYQVWTYDPGFHHHVIWHLKEILIEDDRYFFVIIASLALITLFNIKQFRDSFIKNKQIFLIAFASLLLSFITFRYSSFIYQKFKNLISILYYSIYKFIWPVTYSFDYSVNELKINEFTSIAFLIALTAFSIYLLYIVSKKVRIVLLIFFVLSIPYLGLTTFHFAKVSFFTDRFIYISIYPLIIGLLLTLKKIPRKAQIPVVLTISALLTYKSYKNVSYWSSSKELLTHTLTKNSQSLVSRMALASYYEKNDEIDKALEQYFKLTIQHPNYPGAYLSHIRLLIDIKRSDEAITHALLILKTLKNIDPIIFSLMGEAFYRLKKYDIAQYHLINAIKLGVKNSSTDLLKEVLIKNQEKK